MFLSKPQQVLLCVLLTLTGCACKQPLPPVVIPVPKIPVPDYRLMTPPKMGFSANASTDMQRWQGMLTSSPAK